MTERIYLCLFIFCVVLCQGIVGVFSEDVGESNPLIRRKRVLNLEPNGDIPVKSGEAPYVVNIRDYPSNVAICVGTILSKRTAITSALCVADKIPSRIRILAASTYKYRGISHEVIDIKRHLGIHPLRRQDGIALLIVEPAFHFNASTGSIQLHEGPLLSGTPATIFGWGCKPSLIRGMLNYDTNRLRSITVPIMHHRECVNIYRNHFVITDKDICTYHPEKLCGQTDGGAPLIVDNSLVGVYLWTLEIQGRLSPDLFADVKHLEYNQWIRNNTV